MLPALYISLWAYLFTGPLSEPGEVFGDAQAQKAAIQATIDDLKAQKTDIKKIVDTL